MTIVGKRIADRRRQLEISQEELASRSGTNQRQISRYENGKNNPTWEIVAAIARELDTTADYLLGITDVVERQYRGDLSEDERELIHIWRNKRPDERRKMLEVVKLL